MRFKEPSKALFVLALALLAGSPASEARRKKSLASELAHAAQKQMELALVKVPEDEETCFSPDEPCDVKLLKFIDSAKETLDIAIFDINLDLLVRHILEQSRKIPVRIVVDKRQAKGDHSAVPRLLAGGAQVRYGSQRGIMHNKFVIVDGKMVEIGSFNYTNHAAEANEENQIYLAKKPVVERYKKKFERIWEKGRRAG
jgi:phosphatidylserine/phosphatidylglycerophosphate/cardiolipin synthase-like enzyme